LAQSVDRQDASAGEIEQAAEDFEVTHRGPPLPMIACCSLAARLETKAGPAAKSGGHVLNTGSILPAA
jgi:hypothetical protein